MGQNEKGGGGGQSEPDDIFVPEVKAKELMITGRSMLFFLFQWKKKCGSFHHGFLNFWHTE